MKKIYQLIIVFLFLNQMGIQAQTPGGVSTNLQLWLKADVGVTTTGTKVTQWNDQSGNARNHAQATAINQPNLITGADARIFNHQPTIRFNRANTEWLEIPSYSAALTNGATYMFVVSRVVDKPTTTWRTTYSMTGDGFHTSWYGDNASFYRVGNLLATAKTNTYYALSSCILPSGVAVADPSPRIIWNGSVTTVAKGINNIVNNSFSVGRDRNGTDYMDGDIAEVIIYKGAALNSDINASDLAKIQSYLAVKYGISLDPSATTGQSNYVSSTGTAIWTGTNNTGYQNNIFGLGLDTGSALNQKQATSYPDKSITVFQGSLQNLNRDNTTVIPTNNSFLMLGDNNLSGIITYNQPIGTAFQNATTTALMNFRSERVWKAQTTTIGTWNVNIKTNKFSSVEYVLVSTTAAFAPATTRLYPVINGVATGVSISNGEFMSIGNNFRKPGNTAQAPLVWLKADTGIDMLGTDVESAENLGTLAGFATPYPSTLAVPPTITAKKHNFHPAFTQTSSLYSGLGIQTFTTTANRSFSMFMVGSKPSFSGTYDSWLTMTDGANWGFGAGTTDNPWLGNIAGQYIYWASIGVAYTANPVTYAINKPFINGLATTSTASTRVSNYFNNGGMSTINGLPGTVSKGFILMGDGDPNVNTSGDSPEAMVYNTDLTTTERATLNSYMAIKYGITLLNPAGTATANYVNSANSVVWSTAVNASYNNNVFGIAKDYDSVLDQKVSKSENTGATMTAATNKDFTSINAGSSRTSMDNNKYQMFGDNNAAPGQAPLSVVCPALSSGMLKINKQWMTQETGVVGGIWLEIDLGGTTLNSEISLLVADNAALTTNVFTVAGILSGGKAIFNVDFFGTKYFTVIGKSVTAPCSNCVGGTFAVKASTAWNPLATRSANNNGTYTVGTDANGNTITANNTITYATPANEYVPTYYPSPYGAGAIMGRWDTTNGAAGKATYTTNLSIAAAVDFQINGISTYYGNKVKVVVKGECNGELINPKISPVITGYYAAYNSYTITGNEVLGNKYYQGFNDYSAVKIAFDRPVSKVVIEWTVERSPTYITGYWLLIQDFSIKCLAPPTPNRDRVYVEQMFSNSTKPACANAEMKVTFDNTNCDPKTIVGFTNTLPAGIEYVAGSFSSSDITSVTPTYSGVNFTFPNLVVPSGKSVFYIKVKPTNIAMATTTFQTQSTFSLLAGIAGPLLSDNAEGVAGVQPTSLTFTAATALPVPLISLTSNVEPGTCGIVTYTATLNNNTGATLNGYEFQTNLNPGQTLVASSLAVSGGATGTTQPAAYAGEGNFLLTGMTIPTGIHTVVFQTNTVTTSQNPINEVSISADPSDECSLASKKTASLPVKTCIACVGGKGKLTSGVSWYNGGAAARTANALTNVVLGTPTSGQIKADVTVTYPNATTEWIPSAFPRWYGKWVEMSRYDNLNGAAGLVKYTVNFKDAAGASAAAKPSFQVAGMTKLAGQTDIVKITGYCGAEEVKPKLNYANNYLPATLNRFTIADNVATGTKPYYDDYTWATTNVEFEKTVERIEIEWTVSRTPALKTLGFLYVSDMNFVCDNPVKPTPDNVSLVASYLEDELPTCEEGTVKLNFKNFNCTAKVVNITNTLPSTLQYVANSYSGLATGTATYSGQSFAVNGLSVPAGNSYVYVKVKPTNIATSGTFNAVYNYTVVGGTNDPNPYRSDDDSGLDSYQDTKVIYTAAPAVVKPVITKSVNKCFSTNVAGTGTELTYTVTVNNPTASAITNVDFMDVLDGDQKFVAASLVNPFGGTASDYVTDDNLINITGMTIPANTVNGLITIKVLTQTTNVDIKNVASMTVNPESACGSANKVYTNELDVLKCTFCTQSPNTATATNFAPAGVTTQVKQAGWPETVPNGFVVLESKNKGFVITRLTTAQRDNVSFVAVTGMLIYNTTDNCFQLYNGTIWKCITRDCNN